MTGSIAQAQISSSLVVENRSQRRLAPEIDGQQSIHLWLHWLAARRDLICWRACMLIPILQFKLANAFHRTPTRLPRQWGTVTYWNASLGEIPYVKMSFLLCFNASARATGLGKSMSCLYTWQLVKIPSSTIDAIPHSSACSNMPCQLHAYKHEHKPGLCKNCIFMQWSTHQ